MLLHTLRRHDATCCAIFSLLDVDAWRLNMPLIRVLLAAVYFSPLPHAADAAIKIAR